jgi:hypothetical protein
VSNAAAIQKLAKFADENTNTQGVLTIGDEKAHNVFMMLNVRQDNDPKVTIVSTNVDIIAPRCPQGNRKDRPGGSDGCVARAEKRHVV